LFWRVGRVYNKIIAAVDGGFTAESAAKYAILLAKQCSARLLVVFVITKDLTDEDIARGRESVERVVNWAKDEGIDAEELVEHGPVVQTVTSIAEIEQVDLVVSSARHEDRKRRFFVRSISQRLMAALSCSMIVVRVAHLGKTMHVSKMLVPVTGGAYHADERSYLTSKLAAATAKVTVLRVERFSRAKSLLLSHEEKNRLRAEGRKSLKPFVDQLSGYDISAESSVTFAANAVDAVLKKAASRHFDLILLGATKRDIVKQITRGNLIEDILNRTPCDVIVWHPSQHFKAQQ